MKTKNKKTIQKTENPFNWISEKENVEIRYRAYEFALRNIPHEILVGVASKQVLGYNTLEEAKNIETYLKTGK